MRNSYNHFDLNRIVIFAVTLCYLLENIYGEAISIEGEDKFDQELDKRASPGGMWFGPRLGKRSKEIDYDSAPLQRMLLEAIASNPSNSIYGFNGSKRRLTPRLGRDSSEQEKIGPSKMVDFIPRLGRELSPSMLKSLLYYNDYNYGVYGRAIGDDRGPTLTESKVPPFAPRLGRELYDLYGMSPILYKDGFARVARSTVNADQKISEHGKSKKS